MRKCLVILRKIRAKLIIVARKKKGTNEDLFIFQLFNSFLFAY